MEIILLIVVLIGFIKCGPFLYMCLRFVYGLFLDIAILIGEIFKTIVDELLNAFSSEEKDKMSKEERFNQLYPELPEQKKNK